MYTFVFLYKFLVYRALDLSDPCTSFRFPTEESTARGMMFGGCTNFGVKECNKTLILCWKLLWHEPPNHKIR